MNRAFVLGLICTALAASCAKEVDQTALVEEVKRYEASFQGKPLSLAIETWGIPTREYKTDGKTYLEWEKDKEVSENASWNKRVPIGVSPRDNVWRKDIRYQYFSTFKVSVVAENGKIIKVKRRFLS